MFPAQNFWRWGVAFRQQMQPLRGPADPSQDLRQKLPNLHQDHMFDIWESNGEPNLTKSPPDEHTRRPQHHPNGNHEGGEGGKRGVGAMGPNK